MWAVNDDRDRKKLPLRPCEIVPPENAPPALEKQPLGSFLVKYYGPRTLSLEDPWVYGRYAHGWVKHGRSITWVDGDELGVGFTRGVEPGTPLGDAVQEAKKAFDVVARKQAAVANRKSPYRSIRANSYTLYRGSMNQRSKFDSSCDQECACRPEDRRRLSRRGS